MFNNRNRRQKRSAPQLKTKAETNKVLEALNGTGVNKLHVPDFDPYQRAEYNLAAAEARLKRAREVAAQNMVVVYGMGPVVAVNEAYMKKLIDDFSYDV